MAEDYASQLESFLAGLRTVESGGRYAIGHNQAGASGGYQFLDSTWGGYGGYQSAYLAPPAVQDARAKQLATAYFQRFGSWASVAQAWLGGPGSVGKNVTDHYTGITSNQYVAKVLAAARLGGASNAAAPRVTVPSQPSNQSVATSGSFDDSIPDQPDPHDIGTHLESFLSMLGGIDTSGVA